MTYITSQRFFLTFDVTSIINLYLLAYRFLFLGRSNPVYEEEEEEVTESEESVTPTGSAEVLIRSRSTSRPLSAAKRPPAPPQRTQEPQMRQELSEEEIEEESEVSGELSETEAESVAPPPQVTKYEH